MHIKNEIMVCILDGFPSKIQKFDWLVIVTCMERTKDAVLPNRKRPGTSWQNLHRYLDNQKI